MTLSCTAIVPAHNEEEGIIETLAALVAQTEPFDEIIVAADNCTDQTVRLSLDYGRETGAPITVVECSGGSKAKAQNLALPHVRTDLVLPVDADTVLAPDYLALIKTPFADERVAIAAGCVLTKRSRRLTERGRTLEYLYGFHWHRPIQNKANSPMVCSGCNSAFRTNELRAFGGFPERTIVEDMDYCVPEDHRILTRRGYKHHWELEIGEDVLALDHDNDVFEWVPLEGVATFPARPRTMHRLIRKGGTEFVTTAEHRWPLIHRKTGSRVVGTSAERFGSDTHQIPLAASTFSAVGSISDTRLAALIGWIVCDGSYSYGLTGKVNGIRFSVIKQRKIDALELLTGKTAGVARDRDGARNIQLRVEDWKRVLELMPSKEEFPQAVLNMSPEAAVACWDAVIQADGHITKAGQINISQSMSANPRVREGIQILGLLIGRNIKNTHSNKMNVHQEGAMFNVGHGVDTVETNEPVWCPQTKYGTWVMEHNGAVIPTGNTWSKQIEGRRAVYVGDAVAYAADPENLTYLRKQVWRWMSGFFQNVRLHYKDLLLHKKMLALWVGLAVWEILTVPLWYITPFIWYFALGWSAESTVGWFFGAEFALLLPPTVYGAIRRKVSIWHVLACIPALYVVRAINFAYAWKALIVEMILVPLRLSKGLHDYEKGRADTPAKCAA